MPLFDRGQMRQQSIAGSLWRIVSFDDVCAVTSFLDELERGKEEVDEQGEFVGIQVIQQWDDGRIVEAQIAEILADIGPVFLLDVGIVVAVVGSTACVLDRPATFGEVVEQMIVEELPTVVGVEAEDGERKIVFQGVQSVEDACLPAPPDSSKGRPSGGDIDEVDRVDKASSSGGAAVSDGIGFQKAGTSLVPLRGLDGDVFAEQGAGLGCCQPKLVMAFAEAGEDAIDGGRGDTQQERSSVIVDGCCGMRKPERDHRDQAFRAGEVGSDEQLLKEGLDSWCMVAGRPPRSLRLGRRVQWPVEQANGVLAVVSARGCELIKDAPFLLSRSCMIALVDGAQIFTFR